MEDPGQVNSVEEDVSSDSGKEKKLFGQTCITGSKVADANVNTALPENEAMDTDSPNGNGKLLAELNSDNDISKVTEENNSVPVPRNTCNKQDASINYRNVHNETSRKESSAECENIKIENTIENTTDKELRNKVRDVDTASEKSQQNKTVSCSNITVQHGIEEETVGIKEANGNIITDKSCNTSEENEVEAMITDVTLENRNVVNEPKESNVVEGNRDLVIADAMKKYLDTAPENAKAAYQKDVSGLKLLCDYGSDSDNDNEEECKVDLVINLTGTAARNAAVVNPCPVIIQGYRKPDVVALSDSEETDSSEGEDDSSSSSTTATSSSSSDESDDSANSSENECVVVAEKKRTAEIPKTKGELGLDDLPPIEDLHISVPESECVEIGKVLSIVDSLVVVQSYKGCPALDLDSVLFLDNGHNTLGEVFDVFGKVGEACYCVRFNSKDHALSKGIEIGMPVYYAPRTEHSKFVFLADLLKMKGSDASWEHNNEPPPKFLDYSDDEEERKARKGNKPVTRDVEPDDTQPESKKFNWRGAKRDSSVSAPPPQRDSSRPSWFSPFNRHPGPSPSPSPSPQPLIRPPSFRAFGPPPSHFHNAAAGAPAVPPTPSPWAVPPPGLRGDFNFNANIPPPRSPFMLNQMRSGGLNVNFGGFGQPPPPPPPPSPASRNYMMPTSIPGAGPFAAAMRNLPRPETLNPFASNPPFNFSSIRQDAGAQRSFGLQGPVFMNRNVPPPRPPQGW